MLYYMYNSYNVNIGARVQEVRKFNQEDDTNQPSTGGGIFNAE